MTSPQSIEATLLAYLEHRAIQGATDQTLEDITRYLNDFTGWLRCRGTDRVDSLDDTLLRGYVRHIFEYRKRDGKPLAAASKLAKLVPVRMFLRWLAKGHLITGDFEEAIELPARAQMLPRRILSSPQIEQVLGLPDISKADGLRDRTMMEVLYATGVRRMELAQLEVSDVDVARGVLRVRNGKGHKDRRIPMGPRAQAWVTAYLERARPTLPIAEHAKDILFPDRRGSAFQLSSLSSRITSYVRKAHVGEFGSCHLFRHSMATLMLDGGADIRYIQAMLGHAQLSTTQIYTHVSTARLEQVHLATHPEARDFKGALELGQAMDKATTRPIN